MSRTQALIEFSENCEQRSLQIAAANPDNWKVINHSPMPDGYELEGDIASEKIDAAILALVDLVPERLSWNVLALCETLITCKTETPEHLSAMFALLDMMPVALRKEATSGIESLMAAARREVHSFNPPCCAEQRLAYLRGWIVV